MLIDGLNLAAGSSASKLAIEAGASLPSNPSTGQLFYKAGIGLYYFDATEWIQIGKLGSDGKLQTSELPAIAITNTFVVSTQEAMLALDVQVGDIAVRSDLSKTFILKTEPATTLENWIELKSPGAAGLTGTPCDIAWSVFGIVPVSDVGLRFRSARSLTISAVQTAGQAQSGAPATASTIFTIAKNGVSVGTITFGTASTFGTIAIASDISVAVGDLITVTGPASADATLADVDFTLVAVLN